jgi:hypothetical protein
MGTVLGLETTERPSFALLKQYPASQFLAGSSQSGGFEIRRYPAQIRAEFSYTASKQMDGVSSAFRPLANFIFGNNKARDKNGNQNIAMTSPVISTSTSATKSQAIAMTAPVISSSESKSQSIAMTAPVISSSTTIDNTGNSGSNLKTTEHKLAFIMPSQYKSLSDLPIPNDPRVTLTQIPESTFAVIRFSGWVNEDIRMAKERELRESVEKLNTSKGTKEVVLDEDSKRVQMAQYDPPWTIPFMRTNEVMIPVVELNLPASTLAESGSSS